MSHETEQFLAELIRRTDVKYRTTVEGIIDVFKATGSLSPKQFSVLKINATKKGMVLPREIAAIRPMSDQSDEDFVFTSSETPAHIQADLFEQVAAAYTAAAARFRTLEQDK